MDARDSAETLTINGQEPLQMLDCAEISRMLFGIFVSRSFEQTLVSCAGRGEVPRPLHTSLGQEAVAAAVSFQLGPHDQVVGNHRSHHHFVLQGLARSTPAGWDPRVQAGGPDAHRFLTSSFAEFSEDPADRGPASRPGSWP